MSKCRMDWQRGWKLSRNVMRRPAFQRHIAGAATIEIDEAGLEGDRARKLRLMQRINGQSPSSGGNSDE
jgi:hypothetical protein